MGRGGRGEPGQGVAPLERRHDPSPGMPVGDLPDDGGELGEVGIGEGEPAEGIANARVKAGRHEDELRSEAVGRRHEPIAEGADQLQGLHVEMSESEGDSDEDNSEGLADDASHGRATANEDGSGEDNSEVPIDPTEMLKHAHTGHAQSQSRANEAPITSRSAYDFEAMIEAAMKSSSAM